MYFTDLHVQLMSRAILNPGEQLVGQTVTSYLPWWALGFINRQYLVLATDQRLILVDHRVRFFPVALELHHVDSIPWSSIQELKVKGLFLQKKLRVKGMGDHGPVSLTMKIDNRLFGLLAPMRENMQGARNVAAAFQGGMQAHALPPASNGYGQPQISFAPPAPQLAAPMSQPPAIPQQNAPGYASVPPPPPSPYGVAPQQPQQPMSSAPPPPPGYPPRQWS